MTNAPKSEAGFRVAVALVVVLAGFIAYANTFDGQWVWDDASSILLHKHVQDPAQIFQLFKEDQHTFGRGQGNFYRPLLSVTFMVDFLLSYSQEHDARPGASHPDIKPFVFHLSSLLWHIAAALLLLAVLVRMKAPAFVCGVVPVLYVLHPLHTEAVAYISGRADMMSATFMYAALFFALSPASPPKRYLAWAGAGLCFAAGLCSKESTMIFPLLLGLTVLLRPRQQEETGATSGAFWVGRIAPFALCALILVGYIALRATVLNFAEAGVGAEAAPFAQRLTESAQAFSLYIKDLFFPTNMHMERTLAGVPSWYALIGSLLMATCIATALLAYRTGQWRITLGMSWFLLAWLPISGLFPLNAPLAEHWMYVPMAGFWWALAEMAHLLIARAPQLKPPALAATAALALVFLALTVARNQEWHSDKSLFEATLRENPDTRRVHYNLAVAFEDILDNPAGARRHYGEALRLIRSEKERAGLDMRYATPDELDVHLSLARVNESLGDYGSAARHYAIVATVRDNPDLEEMAVFASFGLGRCLLALGDVGNASRQLQDAATREPSLEPEVERLLMGAPLPRL